MIAAAALCPAPPLLARAATGADPVVPELRQACLDAATTLVRHELDLVVVVGVAGQTRCWDGSTQLNLSAYAPGAGRFPASWSAADGTCGADPAWALRDASGSGGLPLSVGLGDLLLRQAGHVGDRDLISVSEDESPGRCAALGERLAATGGRAGLLVMADGSARRGLKAPGYLDKRSFEFDARVERAIRTGDLGALLAVDPELARDLMATGRAAWQVLAGAMNSRRVISQIWYCDDPFGVAYLVASMTAG